MSGSGTGRADGDARPAPLRAWLGGYAASDVVWIRGGRVWTAEDLCAGIRAVEARLAPWAHGQHVALALQDPLVLARCLLLLDGVAASVTLMPAEVAAPGEWLQAAGARWLVSQEPDPRLPGVDHWNASALLERGGEDRAALLAEPVATRVVLPTSGTTGVPKLVSHTWGTLGRSIRPGTERGGRCWGLLYELGRFAGLQVFLQALASRAGLILTGGQDDLEERLRALVQGGCDALSATPTLWRKILMSPAAAGLALRQVTLGGEIADAAVLRALATRFPEARITHVYASTEAGVGFSVRDRMAGFPSEYLERAPGGVEVRVDAGGRLWLRPPTRGQCFVGLGPVASDEGWIDTGDLVERRGDRFHFLGRASGCINVGGDKVIPEEVEQVILEVPEVALVRVSGVRNPIVGNLVGAVVVPRPGVTDYAAIEVGVRRHCRERMARFKVPAVIRVVAELPTGPGGKLVRGSGSGGQAP